MSETFTENFSKLEPHEQQHLRDWAELVRVEKPVEVHPILLSLTTKPQRKRKQEK
jgi:hypothetical protein